MTERSNVRHLLFDGVVALLLSAVNLSILIPLAYDETTVPVAAVLVVVHAGCLLWRRRYPLPVLGINVVSGLAVIALGYPTVVLGLASLVALYTAAVKVPRRHSVPAAIVLIVAMTTGQVAESQGVDTLVGNVVILGITWFLGDSVGQRRDYVQRLEERTAELEEARDELARSAVVEERLRIARELHDILGHSVGVIAVQAGVGAHVIDSDPDEAKRSLHAIESVSKSALTEIRQVVGALREETDSGEVRPAPDIDALDTLVADLRGGSVTVDLEIDDDATELPSGLQLTIYRVIQEALTNVVKHSGARRARVTVRRRPAEVTVEVVDDGAGPPAAGHGHGLVGMRERVSMHGGHFEAGPLKEQGFRVGATFPIGDLS